MGGMARHVPTQGVETCDRACTHAAPPFLQECGMWRYAANLTACMLQGAERAEALLPH